LEQNRNIFGTKQEHFWNRTGTFLEHFLEHCRNRTRTCLEQNRNIFGTEQEHFWNKTGTFLEQSRNIFRTFFRTL
jgi:hypothetical protein